MASMSDVNWLKTGSAFTQAGAAVVEIMGIIEQGRMAKIQAQRQRVYAEFNEQEANKQAGQAIAISQRAAQEQRRQGNYEASRALAVAAASGGGVTDPTIVKLIADTKGEGAYRANVALYEGEAQARKLRLAGYTSGFNNDASITAGTTGAALAVGMKTGASMFARYGMNGPGGGTGGRGDAALIAPSNQG